MGPDDRVFPITGEAQNPALFPRPILRRLNCTADLDVCVSNAHEVVGVVQGTEERNLESVFLGVIQSMVSSKEFVEQHVCLGVGDSQRIPP